MSLYNADQQSSLLALHRIAILSHALRNKISECKMDKRKTCSQQALAGCKFKLICCHKDTSVLDKFHDQMALWLSPLLKSLGSTSGQGAGRATG